MTILKFHLFALSWSVLISVVWCGMDGVVLFCLVFESLTQFEPSYIVYQRATPLI